MASPRNSEEIIGKIENGEVKAAGVKKVREKKAKIPIEPKQVKTEASKGTVKPVRPEKIKEPKRPVIGDASKSRECSVCHKTKPLTSENWWIYRDNRKGPNLEDNIYWQGPKAGKGLIGCKECYRAYRKGLLIGKKKSKTPKPKPEAKKN